MPTAVDLLAALQQTAAWEHHIRTDAEQATILVQLESEYQVMRHQGSARFFGIAVLLQHLKLICRADGANDHSDDSIDSICLGKSLYKHLPDIHARELLEAVVNRMNHLHYPRNAGEVSLFFKNFFASTKSSPSAFSCSGGYVHQHVCRKLLDHLHQQFGAEVVEQIGWNDILTHAFPDESGHWEGVTGVTRAVSMADLSSVCSPPWHLPMFSCILKRVVSSADAECLQAFLHDPATPHSVALHMQRNNGSIVPALSAAVKGFAQSHAAEGIKQIKHLKLSSHQGTNVIMIDDD